MTESINPAANIATIKDEIKKAAKIARRTRPPEITAVSKKHNATAIRSLLEAGHKIFGENRVQEAYQKWPELLERFNDIDLRLIGPLQSNKTKEAVALFTTIETINREKIARTIAQEIQAQGKSPDLYIQINTGEEAQKAGIAPDQADAFIHLCRANYNLDITGLMCIPPVNMVPAPHFALLGKIAQRNSIEKLSMGMSSDYMDAAKLGADYVRIGTAIFGARPEELNQ